MHESIALLTKEDLRQRLNLPSTKMVDALVRKRLIRFVRLGHRTVRFDWNKVQADLAKLEVSAR